MELATFHQFLAGAVQSGASDIHFKALSVPAVRVNGELRPVRVPALAVEDTDRIAEHVLSQARFKGTLDEVHEVDTSYNLEGVGRFRASVFRQMGRMAIILRAIPPHVPTFEQLGLPPILPKIAAEERGLILVTGITGSGKTSTLAAMVDWMNKNTRRHILTVEDPIEHLHTDDQARITQREIGPDTESFSTALRSALRQDPDVILVGEMRDLETIDIALKAAETGHLVLSTLHTTDAYRTISRILGAYPSTSRDGLRIRLAEALKGIVSQRLIPRADGNGRVPAVEVLVNTLSIQECIKHEEKTVEITDHLVKGRDIYGTQSFDQHLGDLVRAQIVTPEAAKEASSNPSDFERAMMLG